MSDKYKMANPDGAYFLTLTVVGWIDVFTRKNHKITIVESLKYCQQNKELTIFGWCLIPSHLHLIAKAEGETTISDIIRDFKKFTARKIIAQIQEEPESRREWMLSYFEHAGKHLKRIEKYKFWQDGSQAKEIYSKEFFYEKLDYIHHNPVEDMIVSKPEEYIFSSARNYAELNGLFDIVKESSRQVTHK